MNPDTAIPVAPTHHDRRRVRWWQAVAAGAAAATVINLIVYFVASGSGAALAVQQNGADHEINAAGVVVASLVPLLVGTLLAMLVSRWWPGVLRVAQVVAAVVAVVTALGPLTQAVDTATGLALATMHVMIGATAVAILQVIRPTQPTRSPL
jgi:TctA family transporter